MAFVKGTNGNDTIRVGFASDGVDPPTGATNAADHIEALAGDDQVSAGDGNDMVFGDGGNDRLIGQTGDDNLNGGVGDDMLAGGPGRDILRGFSGNDRLFGESGNDVFFAEAGDDRDTMTGGPGADSFRFVDAKVQGQVFYSTGVGTKRDVVADFDGAEGDILNIHGIDANLATILDDAFTFVGKNAPGIGEIGFVETANLTILRGNADFDAAPEFEIQLNGIGLDLSADNFVL
jgi:serralysin